MWCGIIVQKYEEEELEKNQLEAARIVTGTTKLVSIDKLYIETGWEPLQARRRKHKLTLFYKMINNLTPNYLSSLLPLQVGNVSRYNLRNQEQYQTIDCKSQLYFKVVIGGKYINLNKNHKNLTYLPEI